MEDLLDGQLAELKSLLGVPLQTVLERLEQLEKEVRQLKRTIKRLEKTVVEEHRPLSERKPAKAKMDRFQDGEPEKLGVIQPSLF